MDPHPLAALSRRHHVDWAALFFQPGERPLFEGIRRPHSRQGGDHSDAARVVVVSLVGAGDGSGGRGLLGQHCWHRRPQCWRFSGGVMGSFFLIWTVVWALLYVCLIPGKGILDNGIVLAVIYAIIVIVATWLFLAWNSRGWESNRLLSIGIGGGL